MCLYEAKSVVEDETRASWRWILKPSVTNKGSNIVMCDDWKDIIDALDDMKEQREWVLQRYVEKPLLVLREGHKFHLGLCALCGRIEGIRVQSDVSSYCCS